jgi:hypothetical protein
MEVTRRRAKSREVIHPPFTPLLGRSCEQGNVHRSLSCLAQGWGIGKTGEIIMKKIIVFFALICAFGAFAGRPSADVTHHAAMDMTSMLAMMQPPQGLPTEAYDAN